MGDREHVLLISLGYFRPSVSIEGGTLTAGGDLRLAQILSRGPYDRIQAHLLTAGMGDVDLIYGGCTVVTHSIDKCFLSKPHSLLTIQIIYLLRVVKALTYISRHRKSLSACTVYSASNLFPDAFVGWACKWVTKSSRWVAIAHHIPQPELHNERSMQTRIQQLAYLIPLRIMARFATTIIAYNSTVIDYLGGHLGKAQSIEVNGNGIDPEMLTPSKRPPSIPDLRGPIVMFVGRLSATKGVEDLVALWAKLSTQLGVVQLWVVGAEETMTRAQLAAKFRDAGILSGVHILGTLRREELNWCLATADVLVQPSKMEGWSLISSESLWMGTPVVAWDLKSYRGLHSVGFHVVPFGDIDRFASKVASLLKEEARKRDKAQVELYRKGLKTWSEIADREWRIIRGSVR